MNIKIVSEGSGKINCHEMKIRLFNNPFAFVEIAHEVAHWKLGHLYPIVYPIVYPIEVMTTMNDIKIELLKEVEAWFLAFAFLKSSGGCSLEAKAHALKCIWSYFKGLYSFRYEEKEWKDKMFTGFVLALLLW